MSEPTYRIEIRHEPERDVPYSTWVFSIATGEIIPSVGSVGTSSEQALSSTQIKLARLAMAKPVEHVYVSEDGEIVVPAPEPQSLRA